MFYDNVELKIGTGGDFKIKHSSSDNYITGYTGDIYIRNDATDKDIVFQTDDGSGGMAQYIRLDGSTGLTQIDKDFPFLSNKNNFKQYRTVIFYSMLRSILSGIKIYFCLIITITISTITTSMHIFLEVNILQYA